MSEPEQKTEVSKREEAILVFWKEQNIFEKSLKKEAPKGEFVFYDGPPFATGTPHSGSLLSSVSKDLIPRYKTMRGFRVRRRWGWDTHGLPIESLVEKKLGLKNKKEILAMGIEKFNETARSMVLEYVHEWKRYVERVGRWVDFDNSYKTMDNTFIESVWWALKEIYKKGHLYEGRKVLMYCPRDETPLAKAEIAMDETYKDITEEAVTVKFKVKNPEKSGLPENTFILAWTTTPWTLPTNSALAVGPAIEYVKVKSGAEIFVLAKSRLEAVMAGTPYELLGTMQGKELTGISYEPLYDVMKIAGHSGKKYEVFAEDYVSAEDGTGIVHTGTIYGEDDYALILKEKLPAIQLLNANATYNDDAPEFLRGKYIKKAEVDIKADLESRGLLFAKAPHTHRYPHCYRCGTPLIYNAVSSWFINIQAVKEKMLAENEKITWFPEHLKHGRFRKNLETAPDWTISRNRFWASPLPFWKDPEGNVTVIGSLNELKSYTKKSGNKYFVMRHGQAQNNTSPTWHKELELHASLTENGKEQVKKSLSDLHEKIDIVIVSPLLRAKETANIFSEVNGFPPEKVIYDDRLTEWIESDEYEGKPIAGLVSYYEREYIHTPRKAFAAGESFAQVVKRAGDFLYDIDTKYSGKTILLIGHAGIARALRFVADGLTFDSLERTGPLKVLKNAEIEGLNFTPLPHNSSYELDYHLPYIDRVELEKDGKPLKRIPEVVDCWVESGAMPFAEYHYPFENKEQFEKRSPGDFVSEYIGQTRAWFYYMHAMSVELFGRAAFRNVITTGNINAGDGQKLSKSKKNYTDPYELFDRFGADAFRYYLMSSVVMQAEDLMFRDEDIKEASNRVLNILRNTHAFYKLYADEADVSVRAENSPHVLDRWIVAQLDGLVLTATEAFDRYDVIRATRPMRDFVEDFSTWYLRRSRDRMKGDDEKDKHYALATMRHVFHVFSRVIAPVMPFIAEELFQSVKGPLDVESVHLASWPESEKEPVARALAWVKLAPLRQHSQNVELIKDMVEVRRIVSLGLEARQSANIKVRQPLQRLAVNSASLAGKTGLLDLIKDEMNVKEVVIDVSVTKGEVVLDTTITDALKKEGEVRDLVREIQDLRKKANLQPKELATLIVPSEKVDFVVASWAEIAKMTNLTGKEVGESLDVRHS